MVKKYSEKWVESCNEPHYSYCAHPYTKQLRVQPINMHVLSV